MPKPSDVSKDRVFEACRAVRDAGARVTFERVYEQLGRRGSAKVVQDFIAIWQTTEDQAFLPGLPPAFVGALRQLGIEAFTAAQREAEARLAQRRAEVEQHLAAAREAAEQTVREAQEQAAAADAEKRAAEGQLVSMRQELAVATERANALSQVVSERDQALASLRTELEARNAEVGRLSTKLEATVAALQDELRQERLASQQALNQERERAAGERQHLMAQTDQIRQDKEREIGELKGQLQAATRGLDVARDKAATAARVEAELRTALALVQKEREDGQVRELDLQRQIRDLTGELAAERQRVELKLKASPPGTAKTRRRTKQA